MRITQPSEDTALIASCRDGSTDALGELYQRHAAAVLRVARRLTGSSVDAEDVLHDVFLGLPLALRRYEERGQFGAWLRQVAARVALSRLRANERHSHVPLDDDAEWMPPHIHASAADRAELEHAIDDLPISVRTVFVLKVIEGYSHRDIATLVGITEGASEVRLVRAMKLLRRALGEA